MKKILFLSFFLLFFGCEEEGQKRALITELTPLACDLNLQDCKFDFKGKSVEVFLNPKPILAMQELDLLIKNLGVYENLNARVYGLNMYLGDIVPKFEKIDDESYQAKLVLSACTLEVMRFRFEFFDADKPLNFFFDVDVKR